MEVSTVFAMFVVAFSASVAVEKLKGASWFPWLSKADSNINAWVTAIVAFLSSIGVTISFDPTVSDSGWVAALAAAFASPGAFLQTLWNWLLQWAAQELSYRAVVKKTSATEPTETN